MASLSFLNPDKILFGKSFIPNRLSNTKDNLSPPIPWGIVSRPSDSIISEKTSKLEWQKEQFEKGIGPIIKSGRFIILAVLSILFLFIHPFLSMGVFLFFAFLYLGMKSSIKRDLVKHFICKSRNWSYDPSPSPSVGFDLSKKFPKLFKMGDERFVEDQIWGEFMNGKSTRKFYSGIYSYSVESSDSNGNRSKSTYVSNFISFKLDKKFKSNFLIYQENILSRIRQKFTSKEINLESIDFNKIFAFDYIGKKEKNAVSIAKILSPLVQLKLIELSKKGSGLSVSFSGDSIIFLFRGQLLKNIKTKVVGGLKIANEDLKIFDEYLESFNQVSNEIVSKI